MEIPPWRLGVSTCLAYDVTDVSYAELRAPWRRSSRSMIEFAIQFGGCVPGSALSAVVQSAAVSNRDRPAMVKLAVWARIAAQGVWPVECNAVKQGSCRD